MDVFDLRPLLAPLVSFACTGLVFASGRRSAWRRIWSLSAAGVKLALVLSMLPGTLRGMNYVVELVAFTPGVTIAFRTDAYGMFFALVSSTLWLLTTVYAIGYMEDEHERIRFFGFFALCVSTTVGVAFAGNLFTLFLFYETLTLASYPLVVHRETLAALRAGRIYLAYTLLGGGFVLLGTVMTLNAAGTVQLGSPGILGNELGTSRLAAIFVTLTIGFGVKAAIVPLHGWLPAAMVAPTPVSALLHAVAVVKVGAFGLTRTIHDVFGVELLREVGFATPLAWLAGFTIVAASLQALRQDRLKLRLAWSTISQLSYIVLGVALLTPIAAVAAIVHLAHQAFAKITMFFVAGAIERTSGRVRASELDGLARQMPWTTAAFAVAALSFVGVPLFAGFVTKWYLSLGALKAGAEWAVAVMLLSSLLNAGYWFPILHRAYFRPPHDANVAVPREAPPLLLVPTLVCALYVLLLGTTADVPGMPFAVAEVAVRNAFGAVGQLP